ncbi:radical SAM protein [Polyangium aurulentum]|uniref:radical SAM protein n=1 Tax=Polyangium aurulentum TaxID=2567896 RepID=UPI0010ADD1AA|nr:radical SAM protein [Polyangium aurulentum]UQA62870.1 radical SAM protein [Polyangium aurulentum]
MLLHDPDDGLILFRHRPLRSTPRVDLSGDMVGWGNAVPMRPAEDGTFEASLRLGTGVYAYKMRLADGTWELDATNGATRGRDGMKNSLLVVGGAAEPVLHAPASPWLFVKDDGRLVVRAGLRKSAGNALSVAWDEGDGQRVSPMTLAAEEDEHRLFEALLPASARIVEYLFVLSDKRLVGRCGGAGQAFRVELRALRREGPAWLRGAVLHRVRVAEGEANLAAAARAVDAIADLGATAIVVSSLAPARAGRPVDFGRIDPALGGEEGLAALFAAARRRELKVILEVETPRAHPDFFALVDVRRRGADSPHFTWFDFQDEPVLRLDRPEVVEWVEGTFARLARLGADGFWIGGVADAPRALLGRIRRAARVMRPELSLVGEAAIDLTHRRALDAAADGKAERAIARWLDDGGAARLAEDLAHRRYERGGAGSLALVHVVTEPQGRSPEAARLGALVSLLGASTPVLAGGEALSDPALAGAIRLRRERAALARGDEHFASASGSVLIVRRTWGAEVIDVYLNGSAEERTIDLLSDAPPGARALLTLGEATLDGAASSLRLGPFSAAVVERTALSAAEEQGPRSARPDEVFREGQLARQGLLPSHLYLTVTEVCNLRCGHCITGAPDRTREGAARTAQPWLIDALGEAFAAAHYFGFVHGGESLAAPIFPDVLRAIRRARGELAYDVHLLTNGMLLDGERARALVELGVNSLAFSIDGATAETNDALRAGSRLETILAHIREVIAAREALGADLRVGISMVAGRSAVDELPAMGRLAVDLGVDWLKIEEMFPATPIAARELLAPRSPRVEEAMSALREVLAKSPVVLVDHRAPPSGCACEGDADPELARFRAADDYANRARFFPCRMAWSQACVDPDGAVHPIDYHHPAAGSLAHASFSAIWSGEPVRSLRAAQLARVPIERRASCSAGPSAPREPVEEHHP